jgi:lipoate-protein ligase A
LKIETTLAPCCKKTLPGQCFVGHEKFDLLWCGKKIAGAAQRRNKLGLLIQGSVQPPVSLQRTKFEAAMCAVAEKHFSVTWVKFTPAVALQHTVELLAQEKFSQSTHNQKR